MESDKRVKVVHLITLLEFGGAQGNTIYTVQHLDPSRYETVLWCGKGAYWDDKLNDRVRFFPKLVRSLHPVWDVVALVQLWCALKEFKPEVLHTHSSKAGILGRIAGWLAGVPVVVHTFHGFGFHDRQFFPVRWLYIALERMTARMAKKLIFVSRSNMEIARRLSIGSPDQYELIRSGVPLKKIQERAAKVDRERLKRELGIPSGSKVVTTIGAFKPQKNLHDFLWVAHKVHSTVPNTTFLLLGDGVLREELERERHALGLADVVRMPGWREDAAEILSLTDVFIMTSLWEGLPRALVEAMSLGVSSVCYAADGVEDVLNEAEGTLIPRGQRAKMAVNVTKLIQNESLSRQLGANLSKRIGPEFDIDGMVLQQAQLYGQLLYNPAPSPHR